MGAGGLLGSLRERKTSRREGLRERILGRDVLAVVAITKWLLLVCTVRQRVGPLLRQVFLIGDAIADT